MSLGFLAELGSMFLRGRCLKREMSQGSPYISPDSNPTPDIDIGIRVRDGRLECALIWSTSLKLWALSPNRII